MANQMIKTYKLENFLEWFERKMIANGLFVEKCQMESNSNISNPYRSDHFVFIMVMGGEFVVNINAERYHVRKQNAIFIPPDAIRQTVSLSSNCEAAIFAFNVNYLVSAGIYEQAIDVVSSVPIKNSPFLELDKEEFSLLSDMLRLLEYKLNAPSASIYFEKSIHYLFASIVFELGIIFSKRQYLKDFKGSRKAELTSQFLDKLKQYYKTERTVIDYANRLNVTPNHLSQTIKEVTGKTAGALIDEVVLMEASSLLKNSSLSIAEVAAALNFKDQFMFSRYFKKMSGVSPREYRKL